MRYSNAAFGQAAPLVPRRNDSCCGAASRSSALPGSPPRPTDGAPSPPRAPLNEPRMSLGALVSSTERFPALPPFVPDWIVEPQPMNPGPPLAALVMSIFLDVVGGAEVGLAGKLAHSNVA